MDLLDDYIMDILCYQGICYYEVSVELLYWQHTNYDRSSDERIFLAYIKMADADSLGSTERDAGDELYCFRCVKKFNRKHGLAEVVIAYRQAEEERRRREEQCLHPRRRSSPLLVATENITSSNLKPPLSEFSSRQLESSVVS